MGTPSPLRHEKINMTLNSNIISDFISEQLAAWPMAAANFEALKTVKVKEIELPGWLIKVQFNPARAISSSAKVDAASLKARKCFLCKDNRPSEQFALPWLDGKYEVLVNPFPIFPRHLTIPATDHTDQRIKGRIADMLLLAYELEDYTVFYNGPRCGASAPDHMHFQAGNSDFLTIADALEHAELQTMASEGAATLSLCDTLPLKVFIIDTPAGRRDEAAILFERLYKAMPGFEGEEPMMNLLAYRTPIGVRLIVIPRKKHRPSFYGTEGEGTMLLSPASVDMGGVFITPMEKDFEKLNDKIINDVFDELCLSSEEINEIASNV